MRARHRVSESEAREFLVARYGAVDRLGPLGGGSWTSAYGFSHAGRPLVVRFGAHKDWFEADRAATAYASPELPVPDVLEIGDAFAGAYAISLRCFGKKLEDVRPEQAAEAGKTLVSLLGALFKAPKPAGLPVDWHAVRPRRDLTWRDWLRRRIIDDPHQETHGWRELIRSEPDLDRLFRAGEARFGELLDACPERRDLIHGDLLNANVLVSQDASRLNAIFSWKLSVRGDFMFEVAWCSFCAIWYPGIAAIDLWGLIHGEPSMQSDPMSLLDIAYRHHCYELNIGLGALAWNAWIGDRRVLGQAAGRLAEILERGPLAAGT